MFDCQNFIALLAANFTQFLSFYTLESWSYWSKNYASFCKGTTFQKHDLDHVVRTTIPHYT